MYSFVLSLISLTIPQLLVFTVTPQKNKSKTIELKNSRILQDVENYKIFCLSKSWVCTVFRTRVIRQSMSMETPCQLVPMQKVYGGLKSMKTSGIHFCYMYKRQSDHSREQVNIHINTSHESSTVQIVKNHRNSLLAAILMSCGVKFKNSKWSIIKTTAVIELQTFNKIYIKDVLKLVKDKNLGDLRF